MTQSAGGGEFSSDRVHGRERAHKRSLPAPASTPTEVREPRRNSRDRSRRQLASARRPPGQRQRASLVESEPWDFILRAKPRQDGKDGLTIAVMRALRDLSINWVVRSL